MIQFENVTATYKKNVGIFNISFKVKVGDMVFIMGPTGAGKSTILKTIYKDMLIDSGKIKIDNEDITTINSSAHTSTVRKNIGMIFQDFKLLDDRTIFENISLPLQIIGLTKDDIEKKVNQVLNQIDLSKKYHNYPNELSGGEQQKVCVARALVKEPKIILADEPTGNLDPGASDDIIDLLEKQTQIGTTVIMATHNYPLIENRIKDFIEMNNGRMVV